MHRCALTRALCLRNVKMHFAFMTEGLASCHGLWTVTYVILRVVVLGRVEGPRATYLLPVGSTLICRLSDM